MFDLSDGRGDHFAAAMRRSRRELDISQAEAAEEADIPLPTYRQIEDAALDAIGHSTLDGIRRALRWDTDGPLPQVPDDHDGSKVVHVYDNSGLSVTLSVLSANDYGRRIEGRELRDLILHECFNERWTVRDAIDRSEIRPAERSFRADQAANRVRVLPPHLQQQAVAYLTGLLQAHQRNNKKRRHPEQDD